jgi:protein-L-isoaspartate(D-aspartate) O-methyltransferase
VRDFPKERLAMVEEQLRRRGISDPRVLEAMAKVPRHLFVPENYRASAYEDRPLPIGEGQTISQPYMVALMTQELALKGREKVLEIGTGSGYQAVILAEICGRVYTSERIETLSNGARKRIKSLGYENVEFIIGDGTEGYPLAAPYDGIIVTAACPDLPPPLIDQLKEGGRLVVPLGERYQQILTIAVKKKGGVTLRESVPCVFVPLVGKYGFEV